MYCREPQYVNTDPPILSTWNGHAQDLVLFEPVLHMQRPLASWYSAPFRQPAG